MEMNIEEEKHGKREAEKTTKSSFFPFQEKEEKEEGKEE